MPNSKIKHTVYLYPEVKEGLESLAVKSNLSLTAFIEGLAEVAVRRGTVLKREYREEVQE